jgi:hypothetical protein
LYSNPLTPLVCPLVALGMYMTCCFNSPQGLDDRLFPGTTQDARFSNLLTRVLREHEDEVKQMGFAVRDIGTHSVRKGAVSYLASLPGGPPAAATCIRAGWTMGKVKDVYMRYITSGDQFVGRCLALLSVLRSDFAASPPHFLSDRFEWIEQGRCHQFPMVSLIAGFEKVTKMCLGSIMYHHSWLTQTLPANHCFLISSRVHRSEELTSRSEFVQVTYPWNDSTNAFSGIPPHITVLQELSYIKERQQSLVQDFIGKVKEVLEEMGVDGGRMSENNLRTILNDFQTSFKAQMGPQMNTPVLLEAGLEGDVENGKVYSVHFYLGRYRRVPADWRVPRCGVFDVWRMWWIGDSVRKVPPLKMLSCKDIDHLDKIPLSEEELHGRTGPHAGKRRPVRKTWSDLNFLMNYISTNVTERNAMERVICLNSVDRMFNAVADLFEDEEQDREAQMQWTTVQWKLRRRLRQ